jgi:hypothetical protein
MCQGAQRALSDFAKLLSEEGLSLYATRWLVHGDERAIKNPRRPIPHWPGIDGLKNAVSNFIGVPAGSSVLFANRSRALAEVSMELLASRCRRPLFVDLLWPPYQQSVIAAYRASTSTPSIVRVRRRVFHDHISADELIDVLADHYQRHSCDGLFLPSVSHDGVRLPVVRICDRLRNLRPPQLVVVDGAQGFAHTDNREDVAAADIYLASAHKWLRSGLPLGIAIVPDAEVRSDLLATSASQPTQCDFLLRLLEEWSYGQATPFGETVNVAPLVTCFGALVNACHTPAETIQVGNRVLLAECASASGWQLVESADDLQSGILLLMSPDGQGNHPAVTQLRRHFDEHSIAVTCYPGAVVRLSAPRQALLSSGDCNRFRRGLRAAVEHPKFPPSSTDTDFRPRCRPST